MPDNEPNVDLSVTGKDLGPFCPWYVDDFIGGTTLYNAMMIGAYHLMLLHQWSYGYIPRDLTACQMIARCDQSTVERILCPPPPEQAKFVLHSCGGLINRRMAQIRNDRVAYMAKQRANALAGWQKRRDGEPSDMPASMPPHMPPHEKEHAPSICIPSPSPSPLPLAPPLAKKRTYRAILALDDPDFDRVWQAYPKKIGKANAARAWVNMKKHRVPVDDIIAKINALKSSDQWARDNGQFIPNPATWINRGGWHDEIEVTVEHKSRFTR
jgi:uncharacterized protein YdaU (DUF1376 family)